MKTDSKKRLSLTQSFLVVSATTTAATATIPIVVPVIIKVVIR